MKILFVCTSNKDRSPALEKYFTDNYPEHEFKSAGVNKYFTGKHGTHYLTVEDILWADLLVTAERVHLDIIARDFNAVPPKNFTYRTYMKFFLPLTLEKESIKKVYSLDIFEVTREMLEEYVVRAEFIIQPFLAHKKSLTL